MGRSILHGELGGLAHVDMFMVAGLYLYLLIHDIAIRVDILELYLLAAILHLVLLYSWYVPAVRPGARVFGGTVGLDHGCQDGRPMIISEIKPNRYLLLE